MVHLSQHLVLCGGGHILFYLIGMIKSLIYYKHLQLKYLKTIFGTSAGAYIGLYVCLISANVLSIENVITFLLNTNWSSIFNISGLNSILELYSKKGIFDQTHILAGFPIEIQERLKTMTMRELYQLTNIHYSIFTVDINSYTSIELSAETFPDLPVITALHMSVAYPILFCPVFYQNACYIDGGILNNFPLKNCINLVKNKFSKDKNVIYALNNVPKYDNTIKEHNTVMEFAIKVIANTFAAVELSSSQINNQPITNSTPCIIKIHSIPCICTQFTFTNITSSIHYKEYRKQLFKSGVFAVKKHTILLARKSKFNRFSKRPRNFNRFFTR